VLIKNNVVLLQRHGHGHRHTVVPNILQQILSSPKYTLGNCQNKANG